MAGNCIITRKPVLQGSGTKENKKESNEEFLKRLELKKFKSK